VVKKELGVADIDEFNETFSAREDQNFAIVQHINTLNEEASQLEEEIDRVKRKAKDVVYVLVAWKVLQHTPVTRRYACSETCVSDNRPRKQIAEQLDTKLHATVAKYLWYEERLTSLTDVAQMFRRTIGNLYAFLHGINKSSNEDIPGLTELNMIKYLGSIESEVFKLLKRYLKQHAFPAVRPQSRASARSHTPDRRAPSPVEQARAVRAPRCNAGWAHLADLLLVPWRAQYAPPDSPVLGASSKLLQGPSESTGKLSHLQVVAPTVATVTALAANAAFDEDASVGEETVLDNGQELLKPLSLDALRRSAMNLQGSACMNALALCHHECSPFPLLGTQHSTATGEMNLTRTAALDSAKSTGSAHKRWGSTASNSQQAMSATIPALHIGAAKASRRRVNEGSGRGSRTRLNKTMG